MPEEVNDKNIRRAGNHAVFDGMCWPLPNHGSAYRMRWGHPTKEDMAQAACEMDAYATLLVRSQKQRNSICERIKAALGLDAERSPAAPITGPAPSTKPEIHDDRKVD